MSQTITINLDPFCQRDHNPRHDMESPWVANGRRYASDKKVLISVPAIGEPDSTPAEGKVFPPASDYFKRLGRLEGNWKPLPLDPEFWGHRTNVRCYACHSTRCEECEQNCDCCGQWIHKSACRDCRGAGFIGNPDCETCQGRGVRALLGMVDIQANNGEAASLMREDWERISVLPNVLYQVATPDDYVFLLFDRAGLGIVCPATRHYVEELRKPF